MIEEFEWWYVPVIIVVWIIGNWINEKIRDNYRNGRF
jgi:hypothetical protein